MTKKELIIALAPLKDDAEIHVYCINEYRRLPGFNADGFYAHDVYVDDAVAGEDVKNEITIVASF